MVTMMRSKCDKPPRENYVDLPERGAGWSASSSSGEANAQTHDASALWQDDYTQVLENAMYFKGTSSPVVLQPT